MAHPRLRPFLLFTSCLSAAVVPYGAFANPEGGNVVAGSAVITSSGNTVDIHQSTNRAIIDWRSFDIAPNETTRFHQPDASSHTLNRVNSLSRSVIEGTIQANGNITIVNPNGVFFSRGSTVDVGGLTATSADTTNANFMAGKAQHDIASANTAAEVRNDGTITIKDSGLAALVAPRVANDGVITAKLGKVHLASGDSFVMDVGGDGHMQVAMSQQTLQRQLVSNSGKISADGGYVALTAAAARDAVDSLITNTGVIEAKQGNISVNGDRVVLTGTLKVSGYRGGNISVDANMLTQQALLDARASAQGGKVTIRTTGNYSESASGAINVSATHGAGGSIDVQATGANSNVFTSGTLKANGATNGGTIKLSGKASTKLYGATLEATGGSHGGDVLVGGGYQGRNNAIVNSKETVVNGASVINASAKNTGGTGGLAVTWSDINTRFMGTAKAVGGGTVEVSSKETLNIGNASVIDVSNPWGAAGRVLLDPKNITIANGGATGGALSYFEFVDPNADTSNLVIYTVLANGNVVIGDNTDSAGGTNAGAVYLFNGSTGALISTLTGSNTNDQVGAYGVTKLSNNNYVITSTSWNDMRGAVTWASGTTGVSGVVNASNSLVGTSINDQVGSRGVTALSSGNYVVGSSSWNGDRGASTWGNGTTGIVGTIDATNSLVGTSASDNVGESTYVLTNGNYLIHSRNWSSSRSAVTWADGTTGITGTIDATNSLIGQTAGDQIGFNSIWALSNGNYVIGSSYADINGVTDSGAVTWGNGATGTVGVVDATNSLIGTQANDYIGIGGLLFLSNGNYVIKSPYWGNGGNANAGAATWVDGSTGLVGVIDVSNSLVGSSSNDYFSITAEALSNGHYVVGSSYWNNGGTTDAGIVTWGNGATGTAGVADATNSLVGTGVNDQVGTSVIKLTNGNYVVGSRYWDDGITTDIGAATWLNGAVSFSGVVNAGNSLIGSHASDEVGVYMLALTNGNYVVGAYAWDSGRGAVAWGNGATGTTGVIDTTNALVGTLSTDNVGSNGVTALSNGNYLISSYNWNNTRGAVTLGNGNGGTVGILDATNSLVGSQVGDGINNVEELPNGHYIVSSSTWNNNRGSITWGDGVNGTVGVVDATNSFVGVNPGDYIGGSSLYTSDGKYVVFSSDYTTYEAVTILDGSGPFTGNIDSANSIISSYVVGSVAGEVYGTRAAVYLGGRAYSLTMGAPGTSYADSASGDVTLSPLFLTALLDTGAAVTLQANNDIFVNNNIIANNAGGNGGWLTLQAGRSIFINANITTDNGNLTLIGNDDLASGVINAHRDAGNAVITMASGTAINAGTGVVDIQLRTGAGKTHSGAGDITLRDITAGTIFARNHNAADIVLGSAGSAAHLTASGGGNALTLVSGRNFLNLNAGTALSAPGGRWLIYSSDPANNTLNGITAAFSLFNCTYGGACPALGAGNGLLYSVAVSSGPDAVVTLPNTVRKVLADPTVLMPVLRNLSMVRAMPVTTGANGFIYGPGTTNVYATLGSSLAFSLPDGISLDSGIQMALGLYSEHEDGLLIF